MAHWRKKGDRQPGVMHVDLAAFEPSAGGHKYCLVAAVTVEVDKESKLLPIFVPMPKKDSVSGLAAIKDALTLCNDPQSTPNHRHRGGELNNQKLKDLALTRTSPYPSHLLHQPSSNGIAERMVAIGWYVEEHRP